MAEEKQFVEITRIKLDFDKLSSWRDKDHDDLPVCSILGLYRAVGLNDYLNNYNKEHGENSKLNSVCCYDNFKVNEYTLQHIRNFIKDNWQRYYIDLVGDNQPVWIKGQKGNKRGMAHKLKSKVFHSVNFDFINYAPGVYEDNNLEDDTIIIGYLDNKIIDADTNEDK